MSGDVRSLTLGGTPQLGGFVTRLNAVGPTWPGFAETTLGWQKDFLAAGYWICLLAEPLRSNHVRFGGSAKNSGGRSGRPRDTRAEDQKRPFIHDLWAQERPKSIGHMLASFCGDRDNLYGERRIIKLFSASEAQGLNPELEFPPGREAPQFILREKHKFFVAAEVDSSGVAKTAAGWTVPISEETPALLRRSLYFYLQQVKTP